MADGANCKMPMSLMSSAIKTIAFNLDCIGDRLLKQVLPPSCKQLILDYLSEEKEQNADAKVPSLKSMLALLNFNTKIITSELLEYFDPLTDMTKKESEDFIKEIFMSVASEAKNLERFHLPYEFLYDDSFHIYIVPSAIDAICSLQHLVYLDFGLAYVKLTQFVRITAECKSLQNFNATYVVIDAQLSLLDTCNKFPIVLITYEGFVKNQIEIQIAMKPDGLLSNTIELPYRSLGISDLYQASHLEKFKSLSLITDFNVGEWHFSSDNLFTDQLPEFPQLNSISFSATENNSNYLQFLLRLLDKYGQRLHALSISRLGPHVHLAFEELLGLCPNLRSLNIHFCSMHGRAPIAALGQLRKFTLRQNVEYAPIALSSILMAPLLEEVCLCVDNFDVIDLLNIILARYSTPNHGLLQNLRKVEVRTSYNAHVLSRQWVDALRSMLIALIPDAN